MPNIVFIDAVASWEYLYKVINSSNSLSWSRHTFSQVDPHSHAVAKGDVEAYDCPQLLTEDSSATLSVSLPPADRQMRSIMLHPQVSLEPMDFTLFPGQSFNSAPHAHYTQKNPCFLWVRMLKLQIGFFFRDIFCYVSIFFLLITCFMLIVTVFSTFYSSWKGIYGSHCSTTDGRSLPKCWQMH